MKRVSIFLLCFLFLLARGSVAEEVRLAPVQEVPEYVTQLLSIASAEVGYIEGEHGYSKYGAWKGDPYAQWCAEFLCWCVYQVDEQYGTELLNQVYPLYSGTNGGSNWFIRNGRYIVRNGNLDGWGYQWLKGEDHFLHQGDYIPQPGDWLFFTWTSNTDTDHVAMVEYCTQETDGSISIHVIEGNNPDRVQRNTYPLLYGRIVGIGTVHDMADWTMRSGNNGQKVLQLQEKLVQLGLLEERKADGYYGQGTSDAVKTFQSSHGIKPNGIATIATQRAIDKELTRMIYQSPDTWRVQEDTETEDDVFDLFGDLPSITHPNK